jgi:hypothetical protein
LEKIFQRRREFAVDNCQQIIPPSGLSADKFPIVYDRERVAGRTINMPAKSKKQQMAAGAALAAKRGERDKSSLKGPSKQMEKSMSKKQLEDFANTKRKKLPNKKK